MINKLRKLARKTLGLQSWEDLTVQQHREMWPAAKELQEKHIRNCRIVVNREKMLEHMPKDAICAEIGIWKCGFSEKIINNCSIKNLAELIFSRFFGFWQIDKYSLISFNSLQNLSLLS